MAGPTEYEMSAKTSVRNPDKNKKETTRKAQPSNSHDNKRRTPLGNADPYAPVPAEKFAETFTPGAIRIARKRLVGHSNLTEYDMPDLIQELLMAAWRTSVKYDPNYVSLKTGKRTRYTSFVWAGMEKRATQILRDRMSRGQDVPTSSIDEEEGDEQNRRWREEQIALSLWMNVGASPEFAAMFDRVDLEFAIDALPFRLRQMALLLLVERRTIAETAEIVNIPASTIYHAHLTEITTRIAKEMGKA